MRKITSVSDFFDTMDGLRNGAFVSIGYITEANIEMPMVKRKNPETNRLKNYPDYETFSKRFDSEEIITGVIKFTRYIVNWTHRDTLNKQYGAHKQSLNALRDKFGIGEIGSKEKYTVTYKYGGHGISGYGGKNKEKEGNTYYAQNIAKSKRIDKYYLIKGDGSIYRECTKEELLDILKNKSRSLNGLKELQKLTQDSEVIESYIEQMKELDSKMNYKRFESSSIVYMVGTSKDDNGDKNKFIFLNPNLRDVIGNINIRPEEFINIAKENYSKEINNLNTMINEMKKRRISLRESDLHRIIKESVKRVLRENNEGIISIGSPEYGEKLFRVELGNGSYSSVIFNVYAYNEQDALDAAVDYAEEKGWNGLFYDDDKNVEEFPEDYIFAGNSGHAVCVYNVLVRRINK